MQHATPRLLAQVASPRRVSRPRRPPAQRAADPTDPLRTTADTRALGLIVCRGPQVTVVVPADEMTEIPNPFVGGAEEEAAPADATMGGT